MVGAKDVSAGKVHYGAEIDDDLLCSHMFARKVTTAGKQL